MDYTLAHSDTVSGITMLDNEQTAVFWSEAGSEAKILKVKQHGWDLDAVYKPYSPLPDELQSRIDAAMADVRPMTAADERWFKDVIYG